MSKEQYDLPSILDSIGDRITGSDVIALMTMGSRMGMSVARLRKACAMLVYVLEPEPLPETSED